MAVWFPALTTLGARLGPYLPPHPLRTVSGAALSAVLAWSLAGGVYGVGVGVYNLWTGTSTLVSSLGDVAADALKSVPSAAEQAITNGQNAATAIIGDNATRPADTILAANSARLANGTLPATASLSPPNLVSNGVVTDGGTVSEGESPPKIELPYPPVRGVPVVRAKLEPFELPYIEGPNMTFPDAARQVDYALTQTLLRLGMDFSRLEMLHTEPRVYVDTSAVPLSSPDSGKPRRPEPYHFQRVRVHMPGAAPDFVSMLDGNLATWAERAVLEQSRHQGRALLRVLVDGVPTHEIFLQPPGSVFVPAPPHGKPRMTIVIDDMGADMAALRALLSLDIPITVSVLPYTAHAVETAAKAAAAGMEVLLHQPMEPMQAPYVKTGPDALLLAMTPDAQRDILRKNITKLPQAVGLNNHMGSRATKDRALSRLVAEEAASAGMFVLDSVTIPESIFFAEAQNARVTAYKRNFFIDDGSPTKSNILSILRQAEQTARRTGHSIVIGHPRPNTLAALKDWAHERDEVVSLVPLRYQVSAE